MKRTLNFEGIICRLHILSFAISVLLVFASISAVWAKAPMTEKIVFTSS